MHTLILILISFYWEQLHSDSQAQQAKGHKVCLSSLQQQDQAEVFYSYIISLQLQSLQQWSQTLTILRVICNYRVIPGRCH